MITGISLFEDSKISIGYSSDTNDVYVYVKIVSESNGSSNTTIATMFDESKILELSEKLEQIAEVLKEMKKPKTIILH